MQIRYITDLRRDTFAELVRLALQSLDDPATLQTNPLALVLVKETEDETARGEQLRHILLEAIEATRPSENLPPSEPQWRTYQLLKLRYVQHKNRYAVCEALAIGQASYYRCRCQALEGVAAILWQRAHGPPPQETGEPPAGSDSATREALRLARSESWQSVDLAQVTQSAVNTLQPLLDQEHVALTLELEDQPLTAYAHPGILYQAVLDILINGADMLHAKGVNLRMIRQGDRAVWRLTSKGSRRIDSVFDRERFTFGRELLAVYGGDLGLLEQGEEIGVRFDIPLSRPRTILIIDDSEDTIRLYSRWLRAHDYMVRMATNEQELQRELAQQPPDLILLDVLMPHWDGWMALQDLKAREETCRIPVIISSVLSRPRLALALGAARVLTKPISEQQLIEAIRQVVGREGSVAWRSPKGA